MNKLELNRNDFQELHYCGLDSQSTIYTLTQFFLEYDGNRLLVAPHNGTIMCIGFQNVLPFSKSMSFTYTQEAEIIAIDSFNHPSGNPVIGIIFVKVSRQRRESSGKSLSCYFNIYSEIGINCDSNLYRIAQTCKTIDLTFLPYQLYHTDLYIESSDAPHEKVFLVSGGDEKIHLFVPNVEEDSDVNSYVEIDVQNHFVEFSSLPGIVTCIKCLNLPAIGKRLSIVGCKDGKVGVYLVDLFKNELLKSYIYEQDDMVTSVQIFTLHPYVPSNPPNIKEFHVLVTSAFEESFVARGVFSLGFNSLSTLKDSNKFDCVTCSRVGDVDFDGEMEILIGCYGQKLLIYKLDKQGKQRSHRHVNNSLSTERLRINSATQLESLAPSADSLGRSRSISSVLSLPTIVMDSSHDSMTSDLHPNDVFDENCSSPRTLNGRHGSHDNRHSTSSGAATNRSDNFSNLTKSFEFVLDGSRDFHDPVMGIDLVDLTSDSIDELVVMTMNGVHILQKNMDYMLEVFKHKLKTKSRRSEVVLSSQQLTVSLIENVDVTSDDDLSEKSFITKYE